VAGFRQWQARGRQVRKGERSIRIFGYATKKTEDENGEEERRAYFPILSVFDVSQTDSIDGREIPDLAPRLIGGDDAGIYDAAAEWLTGQGWSIDRASTGEANGFTQHAKRAVTIHDELEPAQAAATILHEAAHALMHADVDDYHQHRGIYETEAESVAYIVAGVLGLDTSSKSIGYIAGWTDGDVETVKNTAPRVLATVRTILDGITEPDDER
jgi:antirestriction protein ArdC